MKINWDNVKVCALSQDQKDCWDALVDAVPEPGNISIDDALAVFAHAGPLLVVAADKDKEISGIESMMGFVCSVRRVMDELENLQDENKQLVLAIADYQQELDEVGFRIRGLEK